MRYLLLTCLLVLVLAACAGSAAPTSNDTLGPVRTQSRATAPGAVSLAASPELASPVPTPDSVGSHSSISVTFRLVLEGPVPEAEGFSVLTRVLQGGQWPSGPVPTPYCGPAALGSETGRPCEAGVTYVLAELKVPAGGTVHYQYARHTLGGEVKMFRSETRTFDVDALVEERYTFQGEQMGTQATPLGEVTREAVTLNALKWTVEDYGVLSGTPQVVLARDLTLYDLLSLGTCPAPQKDPSDPRYVLTVVRGDIDLSNWPGLTRNHPDLKDRRFRYIAYIVDTRGRTPTNIEQRASRNGGSFRQILNEPDLPDDVAPNSPPGTRQVDTGIELEDCPALAEYEFPNNPDQIQPTVAPLGPQD